MITQNSTSEMSSPKEVKATGTDLAFSIRSVLGQYPSIFYPLYGIKKYTRTNAVKKNTDLVIEGFPRSANTFITAALDVTQPAPLRVAHHLHVPAQVTRGVLLCVPVLVLIRHPRDCVASLLQYRPKLTLKQALRDYIRFYKAVLSMKSGVVVSPFEMTVNDVPQVFRTLNQRFGCNLTIPTMSPELNERIKQDVAIRDRKAGNASASRAASPQASRDGRKAEILASYDAPELQQSASLASELYKQVLAETVVVTPEL